MQIFTANGRAAHPPQYRYGVLLPAYLLLAVSAAVMAGWMLNPDGFAQEVSSFGETSPSAAFGFLSLAVALLFLDSTTWQGRALSRVCALCAALLGAVTGFEMWAGLRSGIDQLLPTLSAGHLHPGRMAPVTALNLVLTGTAILLLDWRWGEFLLSQLLTVISAGLSFLTLTVYTYDPGALYRARMFFLESPYTSLTFLLLCAAIMFARPEHGVASILLRRDLGGKVARRMLPAAIFIPFALSLIIFRMYQARVYGAVLMVLLFVLAPLAVFVPLVLMGASLLSRMESERKRARSNFASAPSGFPAWWHRRWMPLSRWTNSQRVIVFNQGCRKDVWLLLPGTCWASRWTAFCPPSFARLTTSMFADSGRLALPPAP